MPSQKERKKLNRIFLFLICFCLIGCNQLIVKDDHQLDSSVNSETSKLRNVFISHYSFVPKVFKSPTGKFYHIEEVFSEWKYNIKNSGDVNKWDDFQLIIRLKDTLDNDYNLDWKLGSEFDEIYFVQGTGNFMLHGGLEIARNLDSISVGVVNITEQDTSLANTERLKFTKIVSSFSTQRK